MIESILNYINSFTYKEDESICISELKQLENFIEDSFIEEFNISNAIELLKSSDILNKIIEYLFKVKNNEIKDLYHNSEIIASLLMAYSDYKNFDLDSYLYNNKSNKKSFLSFEEVKSLIIGIKQGDENAKLILYEHNVGLIKKIAKSYALRYKIEFEDLDQQGTIGLLTAIERYDYTKGVKFSTYATYYIRLEISRYCLNNCHTIRIPVHTLETINKIRQTRNQIFQETGVMLSSSKIAEILDLPAEKVDELIKINVETISLEQKVSDEAKAGELIDFIADDYYEPEEESVSNISLKKILEVLNDVLSPRERQVFLLRKGFYGRIYTLEEIGKKFNVSRERIRQIEAKALKKLNNPAVRIKLLSDTGNKEIEELINKGIIFYFPNNTIEQIKEKLKELPESQIFIVYRMFGKELNTYYPLNDKETKIFKGTILNSLQILLNGQIVKSKCKSLFDYFPNHTREEVMDAISKLPDNQKELIHLKYGMNLDEYNILSMEDNKYIKNIVRRNIRKLLNGEEISFKKKTIYTWLKDYSEEEIKASVQKLPANEQEIVYRRYGANLDGYYPTEEQETTYLNGTIKNHLLKLLNGSKLNGEFEIKDLYEWFPNYSKTELLAAIEKLPTKQKNIVYRKFGHNLDECNDLESCIDNNYLKNTIRLNLKKLLMGKEIFVSASAQSLLEIYKDFSIDRINFAISKLSEEDRNLLMLKYGQNLNEVNYTSRDITDKVAKVRSRLEILLKAKMETKISSLYDRFNIDIDIINTRIKYLDPQNREDLYKRFGYDLVNSSDIGLSQEFIRHVEEDIITKLNEPCKEELEYVRQLSETIDKIYNDGLLLMFTKEEILIVLLKEGIYYNGFSDNYIANLLGIDEKMISCLIESISNKNKIGIDVIRNVFTSYIVEKGIEISKNASEKVKIDVSVKSFW